MKMNEDKITTYEVRLLCRNCNTEWVESVEMSKNRVVRMKQC